MTCPLLHNRDGHCDWCGKKLTGRQSRWCSRKCGRAYRANHRFTDAKAHVKAEAAHYLCSKAHRVDWYKVDGGVEHVYTGPDGCLVFTTRPEVNHITPIKGRHNTFGCHHHISELEVLCRPCHLAVTAEQRRNGLI